MVGSSPGGTFGLRSREFWARRFREGSFGLEGSGRGVLGSKVPGGEGRSFGLEGSGPGNGKGLGSKTPPTSEPKGPGSEGAVFSASCLDTYPNCKVTEPFLLAASGLLPRVATKDRYHNKLVDVDTERRHCHDMELLQCGGVTHKDRQSNTQITFYKSLSVTRSSEIASGRNATRATVTANPPT